MGSAKVRLDALSPDEMAKLLRHAGARHVTAAEVRADMENGAPANGDGTLPLLAYMAWLIRERAHGS